MTWYEIVTFIVGSLGTIAGIIGGTYGFIYWRENKALKAAEADKGKAEAQKSTTEAHLAEANLAEQILEKFERSVLSRMDSGDAVRQKELNALGKRIDKRFDIIEKEDKKQNETISNVVEYLNGDFEKFMEKKRGKSTSKRKR